MLEFFAGRESQAQIMLVIARDRLAIDLGPVGQAGAPPGLKLISAREDWESRSSGPAMRSPARNSAAASPYRECAAP